MRGPARDKFNKNISEDEVYIGQVKNGKRHGVGRLCHNSNGLYEGEFKNGQIHGYGRFLYNNFVYYEG